MRLQWLDFGLSVALIGEIGVIATSRELGHFRHEVEQRLADVFVTFAAIDAETDALPVGDVRKEWSPDALKRKDKEIMEAEDFYRAARLMLPPTSLGYSKHPHSTNLGGKRVYQDFADSRDSSRVVIWVDWFTSAHGGGQNDYDSHADTGDEGGQSSRRKKSRRAAQARH